MKPNRFHEPKDGICPRCGTKLPVDSPDRDPHHQRAGFGQVHVPASGKHRAHDQYVAIWTCLVKPTEPPKETR